MSACAYACTHIQTNKHARQTYTGTHRHTYTHTHAHTHITYAHIRLLYKLRNARNNS